MTRELERFLTPQALDYPLALSEMRAGRKCSHWIWYIFPQLRGLGQSHMSRYYGIASLDEAKAYLAHPVLSARLYEITEAILAHEGISPLTLMGSSVDVYKLQASMTLFAVAAGEGSVFEKVLDVYFNGARHTATLFLLGL